MDFEREQGGGPLLGESCDLFMIREATWVQVVQIGAAFSKRLNARN
jgi:hypothetical protein